VGNERIAFRTCPLCEATCGLELTIEEARVRRIRGDSRDVFSAGFICPKGTTLGDLHHDPDRLRRPWVREPSSVEEVDRAGGTPGAFEWREVSWAEAWAVVERGLARVREATGSESVGVYLGNPNVHSLTGVFYPRLLIRALGTKQVYSASTVDQMPKHVASGLLFGSPEAIPVPDLDRTEYLLMLGANPVESNGSLCTAPDFPGRLRRLRARGGKLVVVDPRRTRTARLASEHLAIVPGTDALFLCALMHEIFAAGLAKPGPLGEHLLGLEELEHELHPFTPERVAPHCGLRASTLRRLARELASASTAAVYGRIGTQTVEFGSLAAWAVDALNCVTGNLDRPGGAMFPRPAHARARRVAGGGGFRMGRWKSRVRNLPEVRGELPVATLADEIETPGSGQIRALVTIAGNPVLSAPNAQRLDAALGKLDFMVAVDPYCNETTRHANVILPPPSPLERSHYDVAFYGLAVRNVAHFSEPVFQATGPSEAEIIGRLAAIAAGLPGAFDMQALDDAMVRPWAEAACALPDSPLYQREVDDILRLLEGDGAAEKLLDGMLRLGPYGDQFDPDREGLSLRALRAAPHGIDLGPLTPALPERLSTSSGKVELMPEPIRGELERLAASLERASSASLQLVGRRDVRSNNSWMHNLESLVSGRDRCTLQIHPDDALPRGLRTGDRARIQSQTGTLVAPVEVTEEIRPGVVSLPHGFGHGLVGTHMRVAAAHAGVNANHLTQTEVIDRLSGNAVLNALPVEVRAALGATDAPAD